MESNGPGNVNKMSCGQKCWALGRKSTPRQFSKSFSSPVNPVSVSGIISQQHHQQGLSAKDSLDEHLTADGWL